MTYDFYRAIFIGGLVLSIVMLAATIIIFFLLDIKTVIGDLTGANARKGIEHIRNQSSEERSRNRKRATYNSQEDISDSLKETSKLSPQDRFNSMEATETSLLSNSREEVKVVADTYRMEWTPKNSNFVVETDITYVHSNEIIK